MNPPLHHSIDTHSLIHRLLKLKQLILFACFLYCSNATQVRAELNSEQASDAPPTAGIYTPLYGEKISGLFNIAANAYDDNAVTFVQFQIDDKNIGDPITTPPYSISFDSTQLENGHHALRAIAYDSKNQTGTSTAVIKVLNEAPATDEPPTAGIFKPLYGEQVSGTFQVATNAYDDHAVTHVQFQIDGNNIGEPITSPPYSITFDSTQLENGHHALRAIAYDSKNQTGTSTAVIKVINEAPAPDEPPTAGIYTPLYGEKISGTFNIAANAYDDNAVSYVQFQIDDSNIGGPVTAPPYSISFDSTQLENGHHELTAIAYDSKNQTGKSTAVIKVLNESIPIDTPPSADITAPLYDEQINGIFDLAADVTDDHFVTYVQFQIDGNNIGSPITTPPYTLTVDSAQFSNGAHEISVIAVDNSKQSSQSKLPFHVLNSPTSQFSCNDGIDNDNDNLIDYPQDPGCTSIEDDNEYNESANSLVYIRVPRTQGKHSVILRGGANYTIESPDVWDRLPDSRHKFSGFNAPGQLVYRDHKGVEKILYDCFNLSQPCVPMDPSVSFDGKKVIFSVYRATKFDYAWWDGTTLPNKILADPLEAQLHIVDLETGEVTPLAHSSGDHDVSPIWLSDNRIMFASNRDGNRQPWLYRLTPDESPQPQLYIADANGENAVNISPHELATAMHPFLLNNGRVAYSSHWMSHNLAFVGTNGGINFFTTIDNLWMISDIDHEGGDYTALLGAHREHGFHDATTGFLKTMKALHFIGQRQNDDICAANYYRGNNLGLGDVFCWTPEQKGVEGELPTFLPRTIYNVASWSRSNDDPSLKIDGLFQGKISYPEGTPDNQLLLTVGKGMCATVSGTVPSFQDDVADQPGKVACNIGIYKTSKIPSTDINDLITIVDEPEWHEFNARVVTSRHITTPNLTRLANNQCVLASSDASSAETQPHFPYQFNNNYKSSANHGSQIDGIDHSELAGIRFWEVIPNLTKRPTNIKSTIGNPVKLLGDVTLLQDHSFAVELPCDTPFIMAGIDQNGHVIMRDQIPQSLRPGEERVCSGCHLHSKTGRSYNASLAYTSTPVELTIAQPVPTFEQDIKPMFQQHCASCHMDEQSPDYVPVLDYDKLVWDFFQTFVPDAKKIQVSDSTNLKRKYGLHRPYISKYVNNMFARESLLYWKAINQRMDGRNDKTYPDDIDFGQDHPTSLSKEELRILALWLDSGSPKN